MCKVNINSFEIIVFLGEDMGKLIRNQKRIHQECLNSNKPAITILNENVKDLITQKKKKIFINQQIL